MSLMDKFKQFFLYSEGEDAFEGMPPTMHELEPVELVQHAVNSVAHNAKEWPDGIDLPDTVEIWISLQDYNYFGPRKATCEKRIGEAIVQYAADANALLERTPTVILRVDPSLTMGDTRAKAYFSNPDEPAPTGAGPLPANAVPIDNASASALDDKLPTTCAFVKPAPSSKLDTVCMAAPSATAAANRAQAQAQPKPIKPIVQKVSAGNPRAAAAANRANADEPDTANSFQAEGANASAPGAATAAAPAASAAAGTPALAPSATGAGTAANAEPSAASSAQVLHTLTPELKPTWIPAIETARLIDQDCQIDVIDGDTVGCLRQIGEPAPAIALDESSHPYVSQRQAEFACKDGTWTIVSLGRNGTSVQREGVWTDLVANEPFELRDGDRISFARSAPLTFTVC